MTRETVQSYFEALALRDGWEAFLADDLEFTSFTSPRKEIRGKAAYLAATRRFYSSIVSLEVRDVIVEGAQACAFTSYQLRAPDGAVFTSDVAELFAVGEDKIASLGIYFDSAPFPK